MALYDGFFDALPNEETGEYDRTYGSDDFTSYFSNLIGSGVCIHKNPDSFLVRLEDSRAIVSPGYLFIRGYWLRNDEDYPVDLPGGGSYAIVAHLNLDKRTIEIEAWSVSQAYPDSLVLAIVSPTSAEDTRHNTDICGTIDTAGELSQKVEWAINYIDNEIEDKLKAAEDAIKAQERRLDDKIAEVQATADRIVPPPIGSIKFSASQDVGSEWLRCDGSFVSEDNYPELVAALGKLTPSGDKFQLISDGEIGPQITNGALYDGRLWAYSYSSKKLYGVDVEGDQPVKEIVLESEDDQFDGLLPPSAFHPLCLSIVPHKAGTGARLFLTQNIKDSVAIEIPMDTQGGLTEWWEYFVVLCGEFTGEEATVSLSAPFSHIDRRGSSSRIEFSSANSVPYVVSHIEQGKEAYRCSVSVPASSDAVYTLRWENNGDSASVFSNHVTRTKLRSQRCAYCRKNKDELIMIEMNTVASKMRMGVYSYPTNIFGTITYEDKFAVVEDLTTPLPISVGGENKILASFSKENFPWIDYKNIVAGQSAFHGAPQPARTFIDSAAYLWGKDIYMIFVGTGIIFSRTLEEGSFGYLDTTSVLGTITQFGYLDYSEDEGTLYLMGQDTSNRVKAAKIVLNTLYDYANDGAWLPVIASDGVPAYIKAKEAE